MLSPRYTTRWNELLVVKASTFMPVLPGMASFGRKSNFSLHGPSGLRISGWPRQQRPG
uniref:DUF4113 domain-containing protein n=1 Tax=Escherichia coli TaxID=562 RepID=UPI001F15D495|nr:DUF4113 domain-containing protein [Escherichia coli]